MRVLVHLSDYELQCVSVFGYLCVSVLMLRLRLNVDVGVGIDVADDIGEFNSTKLNLFLQSSQGRVVMLTSGLTTIWSQCVLNALMGMYNSYDLSTSFQLDSWKGTSKMRPCFAAIRCGGAKVSDQELYEMLTEARADGDKAKVEQLCRNAVTQLREGLGVVEPVDVKVQTSENDF